MTKFSNRLRELRQLHGLSQQGLASLVNISKSSINMYERGEREPGLELLETFADFFNVDMDYLLGKNNIPRKSLDDQLANEEFALFGEVHDLTDEEKQRVLDFIKFTKSQRGE